VIAGGSEGRRSGAVAAAAATPGANGVSSIRVFIVTNQRTLLDRAKGLEVVTEGRWAFCKEIVHVLAVCGSGTNLERPVVLPQHLGWLLSGIPRKVLITKRCQNPEFL
jgi:hypothetical protein